MQNVLGSCTPELPTVSTHQTSREGTEPIAAMCTTGCTPSYA